MSAKHTFAYSRKQINNEECWTDTITWTVREFPKLVRTNENTIVYSEESEIRNLKEQETRFRLKIKCNGRANDIKIYYCLATPATLNYEVFLDKEEGPTIAQRSNHRILANKWLYLTTLMYDDTVLCLREGRQASRYYNLVVVFMFKVSFDDMHTNELEKLSSDFGQLFLDGSFSDLVMSSAEGTEFAVHKNILASRSVVLKAHFAHDTTEKYTNKVESPFEAEVLKEVLTFIYSNKAPKVGEMPDKLLEAADYYQLDGLKKLCTKELYGRLTAENAIDTLQLAERHHADLLMQYTLLFIKDRAGKIIKENGGWANVQSVSLLRYACNWFMEDDGIDTEEVNE